MRRRTRIVVGLLLAFFVVTSLFGLYSETRDTCLECRALREKRWICGIPISWIAQNSYSKTVPAAEPHHQHQWRSCGSRHSYSLVSTTFACGSQNPIWRLPVKVQATYARLVTPAELHDALHTLDTADQTHVDEALNRFYEEVLPAR